MSKDFTPYSEDHTDEIDYGDGIGVALSREVDFNNLPPNSILRNPSPLVKFRLSRKYVKLVNGLQSKTDGIKGQAKPMVQSAKQTKANLAERMIDFVAEGGDVGTLMSLLNSEADPASGDVAIDDLITTLIKKGYDQYLLDVFKKAESILVYFDDRIGVRLKSCKETLATIGEVKTLSRPEDDQKLGAYLFSITNTEEYPPQAPEPETNADDEDKDESFTPRRKKRRGKKKPIGSRVNLKSLLAAMKNVLAVDPKLDMGPALAPLMKGESTNPQPVRGDTILDTVTKTPYKVLAVIGNGIKVQGVGIDDQETVLRSDEVKAGIASGRIRKISLDSTIGESVESYCPNCGTQSLVSSDKSESTLFCDNGCGFELIRPQ